MSSLPGSPRWTEWLWNAFFSEQFGFPPVGIISPALDANSLLTEATETPELTALLINTFKSVH
jgi:hypothetical protein